MNVIKSQKSKLIILFILFYHCFSFYTNIKLGFSPFPTYPFLDLLILLSISSFIFLFSSPRFAHFYLSMWMVLFAVIGVTNTTMYQIYGDLFSTNYLSLVGEAQEAFDWEFINLWDFLFALLILMIFIIFSDYQLKLKQAPKPKLPSKKRYTTFLALFLSSLLLFFTSSNLLKKRIRINDYPFTERFYVSALKKSAFHDYGMLAFYTKELKYQVIDNFFIGDSEPPISDYQDRTDYYGLLEGKNVIMILLESGQEMAVHPLLTPNLYRLKEEGVYFSNNYSVNKSNVSEFIGFAGNFPSIPYSFVHFEYDLPFTLPHLLNDQYVTSYFHDNTATFYQRHAVLPQVGFEHYYFHDDLFPEPLPNWDNGWRWTGDYTPDSVTIERILPHMFQTDQPFFSFWSTFSTHGPYTNSPGSNRDRFEVLGYFDLIEELEAEGLWQNPLEAMENDEDPFHFKYYQAAMMDFDVALGRIMEELESLDLLDDTLIVVYGDHHAYYHDLHLRLNGLRTEEAYQVDKLYDTILYMWNPILNQRIRKDYGTHEITTFTSPYIIVPTVLDLLGIPHKSDWYLSYSIFSKHYIPVFYSHQLKALMNDRFYTVDLETIIYEATPSTPIEREHFLFQALQVLQRQSNIDELYLNRKLKLTNSFFPLETQKIESSDPENIWDNTN